MKLQPTWLYLLRCAVIWFLAVLMAWLTNPSDGGTGVWLAIFATVNILRERRQLLEKQRHRRPLHERTFLVAMSAIGALATIISHYDSQWIRASIPFWFITAIYIVQNSRFAKRICTWIQNEFFNTQPTGVLTPRP